MARTTPQKTITTGKMKHPQSKKKLHQKATKSAFTSPNGKRSRMKKRQNGRKNLSTIHRRIVYINNTLTVCDDSDEEEDNRDHLNDEKKRLVIKAQSIIDDTTLWKDILEMKKSFRNSNLQKSNDEFPVDVDDLLELLDTERQKQLILAYTTLHLAVKSIKDDFKGADFDDVLDRLPGLRSIHDSLHNELFGGRVSDDVHISNNERDISNNERVISNNERDISNNNRYIAKYNCKSNVATVTAKSTVACTMMRSNCPVDAATQERTLEITRAMNTSYSSPNPSQSTQHYQYPPTPLPMHGSSPYPPYMGVSPYPPPHYASSSYPSSQHGSAPYRSYYEPSSHPSSQYGSAPYHSYYEPSSYPSSQYGSTPYPYRSNGQHGAMNSPSPPYQPSYDGSTPHYSPYSPYSPYQHGG